MTVDDFNKLLFKNEDILKIIDVEKLKNNDNKLYEKENA